MMNFSIRVGGLLASLVLVACGGGGGGGGSSGGNSPTATAVVITSSNSQALAAEALAASSNTDAGGAASLVTGVQIDGGATGFNAALLGATARKLVSMVPAASALATGVTTSQTQACASGGSLTVTVNSSGGSTIAAGDSYQFTANGCTESFGGATEVMNGSMTITFLTAYDPASAVYPKTLSIRMVSQNFSITSGGQTEAFSGDVTLTLTEASATSFTMSITANSLSTKLGTHSVTLTNYSVTAQETSSGTVITMSATVETSNSRLGSAPVSYQVTTVTPITVSSSGVVTAGSIKVTGNGSSLLLTVLSADTFTLQVDSNGDGTYESTSTVTRSQLQAVL
jgi:hypothetical protein